MVAPVSMRKGGVYIIYAKEPFIKLSVIIPAFNEKETLEAIVERVRAVPCSKEILIVDDGSKDGTREVVAWLGEKYPETVIGLHHQTNLGKGEAIKTGLRMVTGEVVIIQDADLEYHPEDYPAAFHLIENGWADAVYGSRLLGPHRVFLLWHYLGNRLLTAMANLMTSGILTDMETGFKMIRTDVLKQLNLQSYTFDFEVEVTIKLFRSRRRVYEIPITYTGRTYSEGKKITWVDGLRAIRALLKWGLLAWYPKKRP